MLPFWLISFLLFDLYKEKTFVAISDSILFFVELFSKMATSVSSSLYPLFL